MLWGAKLKKCLLASNTSNTDVQSTLTEFSAVTIAEGIKQNCNEIIPIYLCGGGAYNTWLVSRIQCHLPDYEIKTTESLGFPVDYVEACAFAWLGLQFDLKQTIDYRSITGASQPLILGVEYNP